MSHFAWLMAKINESPGLQDLVDALLFLQGRPRTGTVFGLLASVLRLTSEENVQAESQIINTLRGLEGSFASGGDFHQLEALSKIGEMFDIPQLVRATKHQLPPTEVSNRIWLEKYLRLTPSYLELALTDEEEISLDAALTRAGILTDAMRWRLAKGRYDIVASASALSTVVRAAVGREPEVVWAIDGTVPFAADDFPHEMTFAMSLEATIPLLPGFLRGPGMFRFFGGEGQHHLWLSHEPGGLQIGALLLASQWETWARAFERATMNWPLRWR